MRVESREPDNSIRRGPAVTIRVDGEPVEAFAGETVATALLAQGRRALRRTRRGGRPRGLYCAMGACFDCILTIDGRSGTRACMTPVAEGMVVETAGPFPSEAG